ncbi:MAG: molybdopterin-containing oxidoreductase family iron-sulfur binding subunit [Natrialbaceae archaeon]|jgi:molybdopterin-containing oxidoreductase family iron-sulfur binding subunit
MVIDLKRCIGCHACTVACNVEHDLPAGSEWNRVETEGGDGMDEPAGTYPVVGGETATSPEGRPPDADETDPGTGFEGGCTLEMSYRPVACQHCENAPCASVCPTGATAQREDGIVIVDTDACVGCGGCLEACQYDARTTRGGTTDVVEKCTFCSHRVDEGLDPACVVACPAGARIFGDLDEPTSTVSRYRDGYETHQLGEIEGAQPRVYYVDGEMTPGRSRQDDALESERPGSDG